MKTHNINYYGIELEVSGIYEKPESDTGYSGGWSSYSIGLGGYNIMPILSESVIDHIDELVLTENY